MARRIKRLDRTHVRYPWCRWADGRIWRARRGADFVCSIAGFRSALYTKAARSQQKVRVSVKGTVVEFRFVDLAQTESPQTEQPKREPKR